MPHYAAGLDSLPVAHGTPDTVPGIGTDAVGNAAGVRGGPLPQGVR